MGVNMAQVAESLSVNHLMNQGQVWRASYGVEGVEKAAHPTGFETLDELLPGKGWPKGELTELLYSQEGTGELTLLLPLLRQLSSHQQESAAVAHQTSSLLALWVDPPHCPYGPSFTRAGIDTTRMKVVRSQRFAERLWVLEQALRSGCCQVVLGWLPKGNEKAIRRLQVAVQEGQCHGFLLRPSRAKDDSSPAPNRLHVKPDTKSTAERSVSIDVLKRRGGWPTQAHTLPLNWPRAYLQA